MTEGALTRERILAAAEGVLRRFGPGKATVVDVARVLGVSHGSVYRHFPTKAALRDAVAERWLARVSTPLESIVAEAAPAPDRLARWFGQLIAAKRQKVLEDPELLATFGQLIAEARDVVRGHVEKLCDQLARILADGMARGELTVADPAATARALFTATGRFHHPAHAAEWSDPGIDREFEEVFALLLRGLGAGGPRGA